MALTNLVSLKRHPESEGGMDNLTDALRLQEKKGRTGRWIWPQQVSGQATEGFLGKAEGQ